MHYQQGKDRGQVFLTSLEETLSAYGVMVDSDSWARIVDLFVDALPITELGFTHSKLNKEGNLPYHPAGSVMTHTSTFKRNTSKVPYRVKRYTTQDCEGCPLRAQCTISANGRYIERPIHQAYTERNDRRVERYRDFYRTRQEVIEHMFGTWKRHWGMTHAVVKGKTKVESEYRMAAIAYNLLRAVQIIGVKKLQKQLCSLFFALWRLPWPTWRPIPA